MGGNEMQREKERVAAIMQQKQAAGKSRPHHDPSPRPLDGSSFMLTSMDSRGKESSRSRGRGEEIDSMTVLTGSLVFAAASVWVLKG